MSGRISVVIPVYNVAAYLLTCLESVAAQTMGDLEVIMVDDGSTDESPAIAADFAERDPRFRLVQQKNAGLGAARNTGALHASGEFICFLDSDDAVPRHAYELLLDALDFTGSDFATGNVRRLSSRGTTPVAFLARAFERTRLQTHVTRFPYLLADRTAWNKLFRRSFWDEHGLRFPTGVYYEDTPVTIPAHYLAKSVDVIEQTVYLWRLREGGDASITQRRTQTKMLRDRVAAVDQVSRFLADEGLNLSKAVYDRGVLSQDLRYSLDALPSAGDEFRRLFLDLANEFIDRAHPWALEQRRAIDRVKWQLVRRRALPELLEVLRFEEEELSRTPPVRRGRHWYGDYPYREEPRLAIPEDAYQLDDELYPIARVEDMRWEGDTLRIEGYAYIDMLGAPEPGWQEVEVVAWGTGWLPRRLKFDVEPVQRPDVTARAAQELAGLDWSGFVATLDASRVPRGSTWEVRVHIRAGGIRRRTRPVPATLRVIPPAELRARGAHVRAALTPAGKLTIRSEARRSVLQAHSLEEGVLQLEGEVGYLPGRKVALQISRGAGSSTRKYPAHVDASGAKPAFLARLPVHDLFGDAEAANEPGGDREARRAGWALHLAGGGLLQPLALDPEVGGATWSVNGREVVLERTANGDCMLVERAPRPLLEQAAWSPAGELTLAIDYARAPGAFDLVVSAVGQAREYSVACTGEPGSTKVRASFEPGAMPGLVGTRPLAAGQWELRLRPRDADAPEAIPLGIGSGLAAELPLVGEVGLKRFNLGVADDVAVLAVEHDHAEGERGGFAQRNLRSSFYRGARGRGLRDAVLYESFGGREYSDSPRAIHEELVRRGTPLEHLWVVRDGAFRAPDTATAVRAGSREYYEAYARARYLVANDHWPAWFVRRSGQTCLQTWHGAPLKRHGFELADKPAALRDYRRVLRQRKENWQHVLSPGPFASSILRKAFPVHGEVHDTGLPRTDLLLAPDRDERAREIRGRLGLGDERLVLYAPTYRDQRESRLGGRLSDLRDEPVWTQRPYAGARLGPLLDLGAVAAALGGDQVVLFRKHPRILDAAPTEALDGARDLSDYPDLLELLLVADVLVTDYSAAVFDFAATGRPIVFFAPDLETYENDVRGFSIDFAARAPGPLLTTTEEVIEALRDPEAARDAAGERYESFVSEYCRLADGRAASRAVERALLLG